MAIISLGRRLPDASCSLPGSERASHPRAVESPRRPLSLSGLAPDGACRSRPVTRPLVSSYLAISPLPHSHESISGRFVSVALSLGSPPLAVSQHPALWSSDFPRLPPISRRRPRLPGRLASRPPVQYITSHAPNAVSGFVLAFLAIPSQPNGYHHWRSKFPHAIVRLIGRSASWLPACC